MATKEGKLLPGLDQSVANKSILFSNFNLNKTHQCSNSFISGQVYSKSNNYKTIGKNKTAAAFYTKPHLSKRVYCNFCGYRYLNTVKKYGYTVTDSNNQGSVKSWNKSTKNLCLKSLKKNFYLEVEENNEPRKRWMKSDDSDAAKKNSSTLSLHIAAYENSDKIDKDLSKKSNAFKFGKSVAKVRDLFEFPRQMPGNDPTVPQVMQFTSSQILFAPIQSTPTTMPPVPTEFRLAYECPGISGNDIIILGVVLGALIILANGIALGYFFRWNFKPLSRRPTDDEMDDVLDADLPVFLPYRRDPPVNEFRFSTKIPQDTQTIMTNDPAGLADQQQQPEPQQSSIPSELKSSAAAPDNQEGISDAAAGGGAPAQQPQHQQPQRPPLARNPQRGGENNLDGMGGGGAPPPHHQQQHQQPQKPPQARTPRRAGTPGKRGGAAGGGGPGGGWAGGAGGGRRGGVGGGLGRGRGGRK